MNPAYVDALWKRAHIEARQAGEGDTLLRFARLLRDDVLESAALRCEQEIVDRPDDPVANYFDGGLRHCAAAVRAMKSEP